MLPARPLVLATLALFAACTENDLVRAQPEAVAVPELVDFGEVVVGTTVTFLAAVSNEGSGVLQIDAASLGPASSGDFSLGTPPSAEVPAGEVTTFEVSFTPDAEGQDLGSVVLLTNEEAAPTLEIPIIGTGVLPRVDVDPEVLYFGTVTPGAFVTLPFTIGAGGSGALDIESLDFAGDEGLAYSFAPQSGTIPQTLAHGLALTVDVTFAPLDGEVHEGILYISTNDPVTPTAAVRLFGNSVDNPEENTVPDVEILDPDNGEFFLDDALVDLHGHVVDPDDAVTDLVCAWYANGTKVADGLVDSAGDITGASLLPIGDIELMLRCFDDEGKGEDIADLTVFDSEAPLIYTISGATSIFYYFEVDDDLTIEVDGVPVLVDSDGARDSLPPLVFEAQRGSEIRVLATDQKYCERRLDALVLYWGTGTTQPLSEEVCTSACEEDACYDPGYNGPWPSVFVDERHAIAIP